MKKIKSIVTGGAGFIGSHLADILLQRGDKVIILDSLSYASDLDNIKQALKSNDCHFVKGNILNRDLVLNLLLENKIDRVYHLAAESHVDNSIHGHLVGRYI